VLDTYAALRGHGYSFVRIRAPTYIWQLPHEQQTFEPRVMFNNTALPAGQRLHASVSLHGEHHDNYLNGAASGSQETSGPPPSYTATDAFREFESDVKHSLTELEEIASFTDGPAQLPFDDFTRDSLRRRSLPAPPRQQPESLGSPVADSRLESQTDSDHRQQPPIFPNPRSHPRPELPHTPRSAPDTRNILGKISEMEEANMYRSALRDESPFEAARRAQRTAERDASKSSGSGGKPFTTVS
jgi:hypothetical protein